MHGGGRDTGLPPGAAGQRGRAGPGPDARPCIPRSARRVWAACSERAAPARQCPGPAAGMEPDHTLEQVSRGGAAACTCAERGGGVKKKNLKSMSPLPPSRTGMQPLPGPSHPAGRSRWPHDKGSVALSFAPTCCRTCLFPAQHSSVQTSARGPQSVAVVPRVRQRAEPAWARGLWLALQGTCERWSEARLARRACGGLAQAHRLQRTRQQAGQGSRRVPQTSVCPNVAERGVESLVPRGQCTHASPPGAPRKH